MDLPVLYLEDVFLQFTQSAIEAEEEEGNGGVLLPGSKQPKRQRRRRRPSAPAHHLGVSCLFKQILREEWWDADSAVCCCS